MVLFFKQVKNPTAVMWKYRPVTRSLRIKENGYASNVLFDKSPKAKGDVHFCLILG